MRLRLAAGSTVTAFVVGSIFVLSGSAGAARSPQVVFSGEIATPKALTKGYCNDTSDPVNNAISSQSGDGYETMGGADCRIGRRAMTIHQIVVLGVYFNGYGPATSENVVTWRNAAGIPGTVKNSQTVTGADNDGSFTIQLAPFKVKGTVWFTVQVNMDFFDGGQWGWDTSTVPHGPYVDQWEEPGGDSCPSWCPINSLDGSSVSFLYAVS